MEGEFEKGEMRDHGGGGEKGRLKGRQKDQERQRERTRRAKWRSSDRKKGWGLSVV